MSTKCAVQTSENKIVDYPFSELKDGEFGFVTEVDFRHNLAVNIGDLIYKPQGNSKEIQIFTVKNGTMYSDIVCCTGYRFRKIKKLTFNVEFV